jgi:ABC-type multidrug transport system ATPase subunit
MSEVILKTKGLTKTFKKRKAVDNLDLEVNEGDIFGFLGPNGAGKSTTIRMLFELIYPDKGEIEIFGKNLKKERSHALEHVSGIVEKPDFYLYLTGYKNLELIASLNGGAKKNEILEKLELVGLKDRAYDKVKAYSHGMKQRLAIALALVSNPKLVILDEPTNGLDPQGMKEVRDLIRNLADVQKMTIFLSSHLLHEVEQVATRMAIINQGKLIAQGNVSDLLNAKEGKFLFKVSPLKNAEELLKNKYPSFQIAVVEEGLELYLENSFVPEVNRTLVQNNIDVSAIIPKKSLEEYFLSVTEGDVKN